MKCADLLEDTRMSVEFILGKDGSMAGPALMVELVTLLVKTPRIHQNREMLTQLLPVLELGAQQVKETLDESVSDGKENKVFFFILKLEKKIEVSRFTFLI